MRPTLIILVIALVGVFAFTPRDKQPFTLQPLLQDARRTQGNGSAMPGAIVHGRGAHDAYDVMKFNNMVTVPASGKILVRFDDLYLGRNRRLFGNCTFWDRTQLGSYMPMLENDDDHILLQAPAGHRVEYLCMWRVPKIH